MKGMNDPNDGRPLVVGAGPAGLAAAITLARHDRPVHVMERHRSVGHRFHGDMQGFENRSAHEDALERLRGLGIELDFPWRGFDKLTFYDSSLHPCVVHSRRPLFYVVRRGPGRDTLDTALLRQARELGADVSLGRTAQVAGPGTIVATGPRRADSIAVGLVFPAAIEDQAHAIVHPDLAPGGYAYLLVWDGQATLATCIFRDRWRLALDATTQTFQQLVPGLRLDGARRFGGYGSLLGRTRLIDDQGRLYVGEAAGLQDAEWGFGMMTAIPSGVLAAGSVLAGADYAALAAEEFAGMRAASLVNRTVWERLPRGWVDRAVRHKATGADLPWRLHGHWAPHPVKSLLAPALLKCFAGRVHEVGTGCQDASCQCLRCVCRAALGANRPAPSCIHGPQIGNS